MRATPTGVMPMDLEGFLLEAAQLDDVSVSRDDERVEATVDGHQGRVDGDQLTELIHEHGLDILSVGGDLDQCTLELEVGRHD